MSKYLMYAAQNLSVSQLENVTFLMENYSILELLYDEILVEYEDDKVLVDGLRLFNPDRSAPYP